MFILRRIFTLRSNTFGSRNFSLPAAYCLLLTACCLLFSSNCLAQPFGNEWINTNQSYYKITLAKDGIYKVNYDDLLDAGFPVSSVDPRRIQLFFRGKEQAILINGQQDAKFDPQDFIIFYGQRNDGALEAELYTPEEAQPHSYYSVYSDSAAYFLTWQLGTGNGKRMDSFSENNTTGISKEQYHLEEKLALLTTEYSSGRQYPENPASNLRVRLSTFDYGEGWTGARVQKGQSVTYPISVPGQFSAGPQPQLQILLAGRNNHPHNVTLQIGPNTSSLRDLITAEFSFLTNFLVNETIEPTDFTPGTLVVRMIVNGGAEGGPDNVSISYIKLTYPQATDALGDSSKYVRLVANVAGKSYVELANPSTNPMLLDVTDADNPVSIGHNMSGNLLTAIIPNTAVARKLLAGSQRNSFSIKKASFSSINPATVNYLIVTHPTLRQAAGNYSDPVQAYATYRSTAEGGGYKPIVVNIEQLYDQFNYGCISPLAIRHFAQFMLAGGSPKFLFLVGKSLTPNFNIYRRAPSAIAVPDLVPTGGFPGSDAVLTAGLAGSEDGAGIPTGRLNARKPAHVAAYLDKVKEQEANGLNSDLQEPTTREALWRKNLIHLSGGVSVGELSLFKRYITDFKEVAEGDFLGGNVSTSSKTTNNSVELINISDEVNKGVSLITFFGHSGGDLTDIDIGFVTDDQFGYHNKGKYPAIIINGCSAGNIFNDNLTFGEDWVLATDRGALNVIAHSDQGVSGTLKRYTDAMYAVGFGDSVFIAASIGEVQVEANKRFAATLSAKSEVHVAQIEQSVLQGDPAVKLFGRDKPDYETNDDNIFIEALDENPVSALSDSFAVKIIVRNFGRTTLDSMLIRVNRALADGQIVNYLPALYPPVHYQDTLTYIIRADETDIESASAFGDNRFTIILNSDGSTPELTTANNQASIDFFVPLAGTVNVLPHNYAIVSKQPVKLLTQAGNLQAAILKGEERNILFELDTIVTFDSPFKKQNSISTTGLADWTVNLPDESDTTVYYWRTKFADPLPGELDVWTESSFTYIENSPSGWAQSEFGQFLNNEITGLEQKQGFDVWNFIATSNDLKVKAAGRDFAGEENTSLLINDIQYMISGYQKTCKANSFNAIAFDKESLSPYLAVNPGGFDVQDPNSCGRRPQVINTYTNAQVVAAPSKLVQYIDAVKTGDFVLLFSRGELLYESWPAATWQKLEAIGVSATDIGSLKNGEPVIIFGKKGDAPGTALIVTANGSSSASTTAQQISLDQNITGRFSEGTILSDRIGPAQTWATLQQLISNIEPPDDVVSLDILGENLTGQRTQLFTQIPITSANFDLSSVSAFQYPFLRLHLKVEDANSFTPAQLRKWLVTYTGVPEGVLLFDPENNTKLQKKEGETFTTPFTFVNISDTDFPDSIAVAYTLFNQEQRKSETDTLKIRPLPAKDTVVFNLPVTTLGKAGTNNLRVNVNPRILSEQDYSNNIFNLENHFTVTQDEVNPVIDVAFDGLYIMNGDIVSPTPLITVELRDENQYLKKQDTAGVEIFLKRMPTEAHTSSNARTSSEGFERIPFSDPKLNWSPAAENEPFRVTYQPGPLTDGVYTLRVQAEDASGNPSGAVPYEQDFEVVTASQITNFYPYPNPFSTSTRFVFTLTGSEIPDQLKIQIMTVSGIIVREITQAEIGPIRIGNNITEFAWNGTDEFGDKLANGVYLYRVIVKNKGENMEKRETSADQAFKKGFGKLYILR